MFFVFFLHVRSLSSNESIGDAFAVMILICVHLRSSVSTCEAVLNFEFLVTIVEILLPVPVDLLQQDFRITGLGEIPHRERFLKVLRGPSRIPLSLYASAR